jgi:hypothetical protein
MNWDSDEQLADELAAAMRAEREVPARFVAAGKAAFAWRTVDAELAELTSDSARGDAALAGTRDDHAAVRTVTFAAGEVTIDIELTPDALLGQVVPAQRGELEVSVRDGSTQTAAVDDVGWFSVRPRPAGTFRLTFRAPGKQAVVTEWISQ